MDPSDFGRYGSLSLLKRLEPDTVVASYPIDDPEITIGRDPSCSIRLYYASVSALHCKIVIDEGRAFIVVLGTNGVQIDGIEVFPAPLTARTPTTVPLPNNSTIDIHKKRFRFAYPPKHLRPALLSTPAASPSQPQSRRALRMSMITSAHVFTPRPSADPRENLRVLQSPLKAPFPSSQTTISSSSSPPSEEESIVLVESNCPRVVEEDKDLVILDEVTLPLPVPEQPMLVPVQNQAPPRTPARRARASLHRAVLIRSARRVAMRVEMQREEEMEVEEVEESIVDMEEDDRDMEMDDDGDEYEDGIKDEEMFEDHEEEKVERRSVSPWRLGIEAVKEGLGWAFRSASVERAVDPEEQKQELHEDEAETEEQEQESEKDEAQEANMEEDSPPRALPRRPLGQFMTPQPSRISSRPRFSLGGDAPATGPRRVRVVEPWKVTDLVVPMQPIKDEGEEEDDVSALNVNADEKPGGVVSGTPDRKKLSEEERQAILQRRRSALTTPDTFVPGARRSSIFSSTPAPLPALPISSATVAPPSGASTSTEGSAQEDTGVMLARMKEMVEGVKRRQSMGTPVARPSVSPRKKVGFSLLAAEENRGRGADRRRALIEEADAVEEEDEEEENSDKENGDGEDEEMVTEVTTRTSASNPGLAQTPRMDDLRHVFRAPPLDPKTPRLRGIFAQRKEAKMYTDATPTFEGVGELMATPAGYRAAAASRQEEHEEADIQVMEIEVEAEADTTGDVEEHASAQEAESMQEEELQPEPEPEPEPEPVHTRSTRRKTPTPTRTIAATRRTPRSTASTAKKNAVTDLDTVMEDEDGFGSASGSNADANNAKVVRRSKPRGVESDQESTTVSKPTRLGTRRGKADDMSEDEASKTTRRTRKASTPPAEEPQTALKSTRKSTRSVKTTTSIPVATRAGASATRRGARSRTAEEDDDPLDSLGANNGHEVEDAPPAAATKVRRAPRGRPKVKEEEEDSPALPKADEGPARTVRGRKAATPKPTETTKSTTRTRAASSRKTASIEPSGPDVLEKENTPDAHADSEVAAGTAGTRASAARVGTRSKVGRPPGTASRTRAGTVTEDEEAPVEATRTRVGRAKTGVTAGRR